MTYYTMLRDHFLRIYVADPALSGEEVTARWRSDFENWLWQLSQADRNFLYAYHHDGEPLDPPRLHELEKDFRAYTNNKNLGGIDHD